MSDTNLIDLITSAYARAVAAFPPPPAPALYGTTARVYGVVWHTRGASPHGIVDLIVNEQLEPYEITVRSRSGSSYRWVRSEFRETRRAIIGEQFHTLIPDELTTDRNFKETWYDTDSLEDILVKVEDIIQGRPYDHTVVIECDIAVELYDKLVEMAKAESLTLDEFINRVVREQLTGMIDGAVG